MGAIRDVEEREEGEAKEGKGGKIPTLAGNSYMLYVMGYWN